MKVKSSTRGRNQAPYVRILGKGKCDPLDREKLKLAWCRTQLLPPEAFIDELEDLIVGTWTSLNTTSYYSPASAEGKKIVRLLKDAQRLYGSLSDMEREHPEITAAYAQFLTSDNLADLLATLGKGNPSTFHHVFIYRVKSLFDKYDQPCCVHETSLFVEVLRKIESQFPGIPRPRESDRLSLWRSYVNTAVLKGEEALRKID